MAKNRQVAAAPAQDVVEPGAEQAAEQTAEVAAETEGEQAAGTGVLDEAKQSQAADQPAAERKIVDAVSQVKVRVLCDCVYGKCGDVALIDADQVASLTGVVDADPAAVAYAESLVD